MSLDDRTKELVRYHIERLRLFVFIALAAAGGVVNLLLGELSGLRLFLAVIGIFLFAVLIELIRREDKAIVSLLQENSDA